DEFGRDHGNDRTEDAPKGRCPECGGYDREKVTDEVHVASWLPDGWRASGERGAEADERFRCTRVLGGLPMTDFPQPPPPMDAAASRITRRTNSGCDSIGTWLLATSTVVAFILFATKRCNSG